MKKQQAPDIPVKQLLLLFEKAIRLSEPDRLGGSSESLKSYFKMSRQFASMAHRYQDSIPEGYDFPAILKLADYVLKLKFDEYEKIANNLPGILDGVVLEDKTARFPKASIDDSWETAVVSLSENLPNEIDLTDSSQDEPIFSSAAELMSREPDIVALQNFDKWLTSRPENYKNAMHLASKLALSRAYVEQLKTPVHVSLVLAMYNEHNRILPRSRKNPNGEDFVRRKMKQMKWLFKDAPVGFDLILVDDGCPHQSGRKAQKIVNTEGYENATVLYLKDGISSGSPVIKGVKSTDDSRKGGSIQYGMWQAIQAYADNDKPHVIVYTDADMAAPVNQIGLLIGRQNDKTGVAIASRYGQGGICRGPWGKNGEVQGLTEFDRRMVGLRGLLFSKLFPQTGNIIDTQCGLKAFDAALLREILPKTGTRTFSFDIELLVLAAADSKIAIAPIYWHDSIAESNFWGQAE